MSILIFIKSMQIRKKPNLSLVSFAVIYVPYLFTFCFNFVRYPQKSEHSQTSKYNDGKSGRPSHDRSSSSHVPRQRLQNKGRWIYLMSQPHLSRCQWRIYIVKFWTRPPPGSKFFQVHGVFGKIWQNRMLAPPPRGNPRSATGCNYNK